MCFNCGAPMRIPTSTMIQQHMELRYDPGDRVADRYVIDKSIGRGGMGVVYRAHDTLVDETVALKFLLPKLLTDRGRRLFTQEAQVARRLRHDNIVAVHDVNFTSEGILYLSMEFAEGQSLRKYLRTHREERRLLNVRLAVHVTLQVLAALEYAHRTVIHRDIKPENIMMMPGELVKVLDFGLAKAVHEQMAGGGSDPASEGNKKVVGTLAYAAPEQLEMREVDERADLYAVGLVLHELLTLRTPLDTPVTVQQTRKDVSPSLQEVLDRALKPEKELRWPSAREFRRALRDAYDASYRQTSRSDNDGGKSADTTGMVYFEGGSFVMGNNEVRQEAPETEVTVAPFWMDRHPVTVAEYRAFLKETGAAEPKQWRDPLYNGDEQPVVGVSLDEALAYARWCGKDLPTEVQWEFAARGRERRRYPWGNLPPSSTRANYGDFIGMPTMVTMHEDGRTPEGLLDLAGNVAEWTQDPYVPYSLLLGGHREQALESEPRRVIRGGSWSSGPEALTTTARAGIFPESRLPTVGFRCVARAR